MEKVFYHKHIISRNEYKINCTKNGELLVANAIKITSVMYDSANLL